MDKNLKFGIHKKYGIDIDSSKQKPKQYQLVEIVGKREVIIKTVFYSQYPILVAKKGEMIRNNYGFYDGVQHKLIIRPLF